MIKPVLTVLVVATLLSTAACGPDQPAAQPSSPAPTAANAATTTPPPAAAGVTPDQVCGLVTLAQMSQYTGFTISSTRSETSGNVAVCHFLGTAQGSSSPVSKVILEYQPDGKSAVEYTKSHGETVPGLGAFAVYFATSGQLSVEVGADAVVHVFMEDIRANHNDPKGAAVNIARTAVAGLPHS